MLTQTGRGPVTVFLLLHHWPDAYCVLATTRTGPAKDTCVIGVIPVPGNELEPGDLYAVAERHYPRAVYGSFSPMAQRAVWLACTAWAARVVPKPESFTVDTEWTLDMGRRVDLAGEKEPMAYGASSIVAGRIALAGEALMVRARGILPPPRPAQYGPVQPARSRGLRPVDSA